MNFIVVFISLPVETTDNQTTEQPSLSVEDVVGALIAGLSNFLPELNAESITVAGQYMITDVSNQPLQSLLCSDTRRRCRNSIISVQFPHWISHRGATSSRMHRGGVLVRYICYLYIKGLSVQW